MSATRYLYLARHAEPDADGSGLSAHGFRQADALGRRLATPGPDGTVVESLTCGPSARARATADAVAQHVPGAGVQACEEAGDLVPYVPERSELPPEYAEGVLDFVRKADGVHDPELTRACLERFAGPVRGDRGSGRDQREVVVTHAFTVGFLVAHALHAPPWRWVSLAPAHASLTVIRYPLGAPASVTVYNNVSHLPGELRWTGFPDHLRP
ncbi:histidine phosphatase family protein [Nocardiopsis sp. HNM0947]|uniref:Histidine phosphatase family protein n=1 Tax=Nocardiopsis coralli TaxID=2772213 RepID=A0ABR9P829_9ACTN|nr:histidine phosphatase family protein [Nocardiopsis coralli]MBE2999991.1 histidine phosphatase family protein [Nocardiopsis coralli]